MGQLQERHDHAERDLAAVRHDIGTLTAERDHLANQVGAGRSSGWLLAQVQLGVRAQAGRPGCGQCVLAAGCTVCWHVGCNVCGCACAGP